MEPETRTWVQVIYLGIDPGKQESEIRGEANKELQSPGIPLRTLRSVPSEGWGPGHLSYPPQLRITPRIAYLSLFPGWVGFLILKETSESGKQEPLPSSLEVGQVAGMELSATVRLG